MTLPGRQATGINEMASLRVWSTVFLLILVCVVATAPGSLANERPLIVAVNYPLSYFAHRLAGENAEVLFPVPAGRDPSFWRPSIAEIGKIQTADLILLNGAGFAKWTEKTTLPRSALVDTSRGFKDRYIKTETITHSHGVEGEHSHTGIASYTWLDQQLATEQAESVAQALKQRLPGQEGSIDQNLNQLRDELAELDAAADRLAEQASGITIIATHPRYQYFARAYGLTIESLEWEAGEPPNAEQLADLAEMAATSDKTLLVWEEAPPEVARNAVAELGISDLVFPTLAKMPEKGEYVSVFAKSVRVLAKQLSELANR